MNKICFLSARGHNNFYYPTETRAVLSPDCEYEVIAWTSGGSRGLEPIRVKSTCVTPLTLNEDCINNSLFQNSEAYIVVWVIK